MKKEVVLVYRKQFPHTYSIEFIFDQVFDALKGSQKMRKVVLPRFSNSFLNRLINIFSMLRLRHKIVHVTGDVHYAVLGAYFSIRVLTIHDLAFMQQSAGLKRHILKWFWVVLPVKFVHRVIVISEATKKDLLNYVKVDQQKIIVIPDFISTVFRPPVHRTFCAACPRLLQIGTAFNKNLKHLAAAIQGVNCVLVIIGKLYEDQILVLNQLKINYINYVGLSTEEVYQEYLKADLLTFVSTTEGFGMPILEAQACGLPVITSACSAMPEVAGDAAWFVDPENVDSIRNGILRLIGDDELRTKLIANGLDNVKRFSKEKVAAEYFALYQTFENGN